MGSGPGRRTPQAQRPFASRRARFPAALTGARLDARDGVELVAEAAEIARLIRFDAATTWQHMLNLDAVPSLALLGTVDAHARLRGPSAEPEGGHASLRGRIEALFALAEDVDRWLAPLEGAQRQAEPVLLAVERAVDRILEPRLRRMRQQIAEVGVAGLALDGLGMMEGGLAARRGFAAVAAEVRRTSRAIEEDADAKAVLAVEDAAEALARELSHVAARSRAAFQDALQTPDHVPHVALVMAFAALFRHAQGWVNAVPMRIVDHYQADLLREVPRGSGPDAVVLVAVRKPAAKVVIPRGAEFGAGKGADGSAVVFAAERALHVTGAVCAAARAWLPTAVDAAHPMGFGLAALVPQPDGSIGDADRGIAGLKGPPAAVPALVVASPAFGAAGAFRRILIVIEQRAPAVLEPDEVHAAVSGADGWIPAPHCAATADPTRLVVELRFDAASPAIAVGPPGVCPRVEAVRLSFGRAALALSRTALNPIWAYVTVTDAASVAVSDADDPLGGSVAPAPFGAPPAVGRALRIDHPGLAGSDLRRMALGLTWDALPAGPRGFADHYGRYVVDRDGSVGEAPLIDNASFKVRIVTPLADPSPADLPLFQVQPAGEAERVPDLLSDEGGFALGPPADPPASGPLAKTSWFAFEASRDAAQERGPDHVRVELTAPVEGFGDVLYPINVAYAGMLAARAAMPSGSPFRAAKGNDRPAAAFVLPPPPWRPALRAVRLDYARFVTTSSRAGALQLFQDVPGEGLAEVGGVPDACVLPPPPRGPTLDIGLRGLHVGQIVSLLFRIAPAEADDAADHRPAWSYLSEGRWRGIDSKPAHAGYEGPSADDFVIDGTDGLRATGLVSVPVKAPPDGAGLVWIRAELGQGAAIPAITAVTPDAFRAVRVLSDPRDPLAPVPAGTIAKAPMLAGLARLDQPLDSAGGRPPERADDVRSRATERLRHRQRATRIWDAERIVLAACPDVVKVRVAGAGADGGMRVVAIPGAPGPRPQFTPARRAEIRAVIKGCTSPFAEVEVLAPRYRDVDFEADVAFDPAADPVDAAAALRLDIGGLLSAQAEPGLGPEDLVSAAALRSALRDFIQGRPLVSRVHFRGEVVVRGAPGSEDAEVGFADVLVAGAITLVPVLSSAAGTGA